MSHDGVLLFNQLCDAYGRESVIDVLVDSPLAENARVEGYSIFLVRQAFAAQETLWRGPIDQMFVRAQANGPRTMQVRGQKAKQTLLLYTCSLLAVHMQV